MKKTIALLSLLASTSAFAGLTTNCEFQNGRVFIDSRFKVYLQSDARRYTDFQGTFHVFLTEEDGEHTEIRTYDRWGRVDSDEEAVLIIDDALPYRLQSCQVVFSGQQSDR